MVWPFGHILAFFNTDKNSIFLDLFWTNLSKFKTFYEILNFNSVILTKKIGLYLAFFHFFRIWPFLKLIMVKFGLLNFSESGNPGWRLKLKEKIHFHVLGIS